MSLPQYQVVVLNPLNGSVKAVFDSAAFYDLRYSRILNDVGLIAITFPSALETRAVFTLDSFIEVYREDPNGDLRLEDTYLCRLVHRFVESDEERFVVGGLSLNHLIARRIIDPDDDPLIAGGYSTKSGPAHQVIYDYCNEQMGAAASVARRTPGLTIVAAPIGRPIGARLRHENLLVQIQGLAKSGAVDFRIVRTSGANLELQIGAIGADKTYTTNAPMGLPWVGLSPKRGNLTEPSLVADRKEEANFIYALGQGQRDRRIVYKKAGTGLLDSPFNRIEFAEDIRNVERSDVLALITGGDAALQERTLKNEFTYKPTGQEPGNVYDQDWFLGDAVTINWDETLLDLRITSVEIAISAEGETITATVTDDFVFPGSAIPADVTLPNRATLWHDQATAVSGLAPDYVVVVVGQRYRFYTYQPDHLNGNSFTHSFLLAEGTYTFYVLGYMGAVSGTIDWYMDDVYFATQDWYANPDVANEVKSAAVTVIGDGYHVLRGVINGKNALSGDYYLALTKYWLKAAVD